MIRRVSNDDESKKVIEYIGEDFSKCIYLYLDLKKYGIENENIKTWIQYDSERIVSVMLKYYTGMHIYSKEHNFNIEEVAKLVLEEQPTMICGEKQVIEKIYKSLPKTNYEIETGWVRELRNIENINDNNILKAEKGDFKQIARLLYDDDDLGSSYKLDELENQLYERNKEGFVRNYVIKEDGRVVSHAATGAEGDKLAMLAYVITDPEYRGKGLARKVCEKVCKDVIDEGKKVYLINYSKESTALYDKIGFKICAEWAKMFINLKK